jgi:hypothetical protein
MHVRLSLASALAIFLHLGLAAQTVPWPPALSLANGGYWTERVPITITNAAPEPLAGEPLSVSVPDLAGAPVPLLRACRSDGVELLFDVVDREGHAKREGALSRSDQIVLPVDCQARSTSILFLYAGNAEAWPVPDFLPSQFAERAARPAKSGVGVSIGQSERLELRPAPAIASTAALAGSNWCEVRVRHFANSTAMSLVRVNLRQALARLPGLSRNSAAQVFTSEGAELPCYRLGGGADLLFRARLEPTSEALFQIRLIDARHQNPKSTLADYEALLNSSANLVVDGSFENGDRPTQWNKPGDGGPHQITAGFNSGARFGQRALKLTVGENAKGDWIGWNSREIPIRPGAIYLLSGWLKASNLQGSAVIHAHFHNAQGALTQSGAMVSTQPSVSGETDWSNSSGYFQAPPDAATVQLHLTMNTEGTLQHDGIVLCEVVDGGLERVHSAGVPLSGGGLRVWEVNPLVKVFPDTPPQSQVQAVGMQVARNEFQAFELALRGAPGQSNHWSLSVSPLRGQGNAALPPVKIERVGYVPIDYPSSYYSTDAPEWQRKVPQGAASTDGWAGWWPDPLAPGSSLDLTPGQTQPIWFTVHAPKDAAPGTYQAELTLDAGGNERIQIPLRVQVLPFALPDRGQLRAIFDLRFGPGGGFGSGIASKEDRRLWLRFIAEHRLGIDGIEPPPHFSYRDGKVTMDARDFDEMARFCFDDLGINVAYTPQFFYLFGWAYPPKKLFGLEPFTPEWNSALQQAYRLFTEHVRQKGWHDRFVYYISDEPHFQHEFVVEQMTKLCALVHEVDASIPIYSSTWRHCPAWDHALDLWGIGQFGCFPVAEMRKLQEAGKHMWFTCDGQMATDTPCLATERLLPYYCFKYGVSGFEFWGLAWWTYNPWRVGWHQFIRQSDEGKKFYWIRYPDGDGYLAYPGKPVGVDGPASTIRLEQIRQGLQDYEALRLLADLAGKAKQDGRPLETAERAIAMARDLVTIPNAGGLRSSEILPEPDRVPEVRKAVYAAIVDALSPHRSQPGATPQ